MFLFFVSKFMFLGTKSIISGIALVIFLLIILPVILICGHKINKTETAIKLSFTAKTINFRQPETVKLILEIHLKPLTIFLRGILIRSLTLVVNIVYRQMLSRSLLMESGIWFYQKPLYVIRFKQLCLGLRSIKEYFYN